MSGDLIVVVPGITGSVLRSGDRDVWNLSFGAIGGGLRSLAGTIERLRLPSGLRDEAPDGSDALTPGGLITGWHVWPGFWVGSGYGSMLQALRKVNAAAVREFGYDWRLSNRLTASLLAKKVEGWLGEWRQQTKNDEARVVYVCHSMGGLVVRYYLEALGGRATARRIITLGTPYSGSVNAVRALTGDAFAKLGGLGARLTEVVRTFPALGQLLPVYHCVNVGDTSVRLNEVAVQDLSGEMIADGLAFHDQLSAAIVRNGPPPYSSHVLVGKLQPTLQSLRVDNGQVRFLRSQRGIDHQGDGTVPIFAAVPPEQGEVAPATLHACRHGSLPSAKLVLEAVCDVLRSIDLGATLDSRYELGLDVPDVVEAAKTSTFPVVVTASRPDLPLRARLLTLAGDDDRPAETELLPDGHGAYLGVLPSVPGYWRVEVTAVGEESVEIDDVVVVA